MSAATQEQLEAITAEATRLAAEEFRALSKRSDLALLGRPVVVALVLQATLTHICDAEHADGPPLTVRAIRALLLVLRAAAENAVPGDGGCLARRDVPQALEVRR